MGTLTEENGKEKAGAAGSREMEARAVKYAEGEAPSGPVLQVRDLSVYYQDGGQALAEEEGREG